ncbi:MULTISPECIES: SIMPL domain-containing protein [unclassified Arsukibacterium]|uniref:SIMPL domain-containing protein n=1 Tax=unclassified Arsukibacterium TaxID=2635278 RepID=UPI000C927201|nr:MULTISPECIES: SIMPL domain-containing protein [unclassified Arsukibacterium]MAA95897.1 SIMPL domain-containing protein [Rheinheimera sp.]|tara:strand:+ start:130114 stop:130824 length:711 start_codon:yes stop_codon:yes gene_type:complete
MKTLISIILFVSAFTTLANGSLPANRHVAVQGSAELTARPDKALISFDVSSLQPTALEAKADVDSRVNQFLDGLKDYAVTTEGVTASNLLTEPYYIYTDGDEQQLAGYRAERSIKVELTKIDQLNELINFGLKVQVNEVTNIQLQASDSEEMQTKVTAMAVANAKIKAQALASAFDARLGRIYSINSNTHRQQGGYERIEVTGARLGAANAAPGRYLQATVKFSSTVDAVFDLTVE